MANVKVINNNLDSNLNGTNFNNIPSETIFSFGSFTVTSNFEGRIFIDYTNTLSAFVSPITLDTMNISDIQSQILTNKTTNAVLNLDNSNLNTFVKFGSAYEFLRTTVENIILSYPGSLFANSQITRGNNISTFQNLVYDSVTNTSIFLVPTGVTVNTFGLIMNIGNSGYTDTELKNLNLSYTKYIVWSAQNPTGNSYSIIGFTGYCTNNPSSLNYKKIIIQTVGNPFSYFPYTPHMSGKIDFHIKPNSFVFEEFRSLLTDYERYIVSERVSGDTSGFKFMLKDPTLLDNGTIVYSDLPMLWSTSDKYNIDINTPNYRKFLEIILTIGTKYDTIKTDLIARFLTPDSIKTYDLTDQGKMTKLLRIYGREFDQLKEFIDSLVNINHVSYDKINNIPDQLIKNLARTFGWDYFSLVNENELVQNFLTINDSERNLNTDLMPAEIDIELWRRILINTNYFWKAKGTREAIKSIFLLIGIPEPFINITEHVYTVDGKIDPNQVALTQADFPSNSLPYDTNGYPVAPLETTNYYFQVSGDTDGGQTYFNAFRKAGFNLYKTVDNRKSWVQAGATIRIDNTTPQYYQEDSKLVLNTKEVDVALDTSRGIEYDVYDYIKNIDFPINSTGYTLPISFVNISLGVSAVQKTFTLPYNVNNIEGDFEVRYNGILLNAPTLSGTTLDLSHADYSATTNTFTLLTASAYSNNYRRDVIEATFIYSGGSHPVTGITVKYVVTRVNAKLGGTYIPLPSYPRGDVQVTINGIALTKGTDQFIADYILDPANSTGGTNNIIIQNPDVISYLAINPNVQIAYVQVAGSNDINVRSEVLRVDSFNSSKIYFNYFANRYVYKLNFMVNNASEVKVMIDGIALEPNTDYSINQQNQYEIFLPRGIRYGTVISVYYLIAKSSYFTPIINNVFGIGDISKLSFLEFIDLIERKMINARNRKTITDFKGGWYPSLLNVYFQYLKRSILAPDDPLLSNGYTFENLYSFLSKYNAFFQRFVDQLLSATIILGGSGLLIRNTIFTTQKFTYKRGVNLYASGSSTSLVDMRGLPMVQYLGDDGSMFKIGQPTSPPPPPVPVLHVDTFTGTSGIGSIIGFGGYNISCSTGLNQITQYGIRYRVYSGDPWIILSETGAPTIDNFTMSVTGLLENTTYMYQAYILVGSYAAYGKILYATTLSSPIVPGLKTKLGLAGTYTINSGGILITGGTLASWYGMQYNLIGPVIYDISVSPTTLSMPSGKTTCNVSVCGCTWDTYSIISSAPSWVSATCTAPSPSGTISQVTTCLNNSGTARSGTLCYIPISGSTKYVTVNQVCGPTTI